MNRITFSAHIAFKKSNIIKPANYTFVWFPGNHNSIAVNKKRILILNAGSNRSFSDKNGIFVSKDFRIMPGDDALINSIYNPNIVGGGSKIGIPVKIKTVSFHCSIIIIYPRIFHKIACITTSIIKTAFTIDGAGLTFYSRRPIQISVSGFAVKI